MTAPGRFSRALRETPVLALTALRLWSARSIVVAVVAASVVAVGVGLVTVLIPNDVFARDIPPVWWNYPVWLITSALAGMLLATYLSSNIPMSHDEAGQVQAVEGRNERRAGRWGIAGSVLSWFAVGCPVCNKIALLALGYSGAITWFAPMQPLLAVAALVLTGSALVWRLRGQVACPMPRQSRRRLQRQ